MNEKEKWSISQMCTFMIAFRLHDNVNDSKVYASPRWEVVEEMY